MAETTEILKEEEMTERSAPASKGPRSYFQQHPWAKWGLLSVMIIVLVGLYFAWRYYSVRESTDDAQIDGNVYPISARIGGHTIGVEVENNEFVKKGTILVRLDPTDYQVVLEHAQANYANTLARAEASRAGVPITSLGA